MRMIPLTQGKFATVDDEWFDYLSQWKWTAHKNKYVWYAERKEGSKVVKMHRLITGAPDGSVVDHKDGNGLNNTKGNLRICTVTENTRNRTRQKNNTTGYRGVSTYLYTKKYEARIKVNKKTIHLGVYGTAEQAARVYDKAARDYFGEFANLNFPEEG